MKPGQASFGQNALEKIKNVKYLRDAREINDKKPYQQVSAND